MRRTAQSVTGPAVLVALLAGALAGSGAFAASRARIASRLPGGTHLLDRIGAGRVTGVAAITAFNARRVSRIRSDVRAAGMR